jgi:hypothetical protein
MEDVRYGQPTSLVQSAQNWLICSLAPVGLVCLPATPNRRSGASDGRDHLAWPVT